MNLRLLTLLLVLATPIFGQSLPPAGPQPSPEEKKELEAGVEKLGKEINSLATDLMGPVEPGVPRVMDKRMALALCVPDVQVYHKAVRFAVQYGEICDVAKARKAQDTGMNRAALLREGKTPWITEGGVRGYRSRIDGSIQPYMLAVPKNYDPATKTPYRVDIFCHGRDEKLTDLNFISGKPPATSEDHFVVHPYGRYCVANKFAGEVDLFEVLQSMKEQYPIDENRIVLTGFSMGGAAVWHLATHYPDRWVAASPGAGFAETRRYQNIDVNGPNAPPWYEQRLWHLYDATDYAGNLANLPLIAYHGELDKQKQSSDVMEAAMSEEGLKLTRIVGPGVGHKYEEKAKAELDRRLSEYAHVGRNPIPPEVHFTTWTLRYNKCFWVSLEGLDEHWKRARVDAKLIDNQTVEAKTSNVSAITFDLPLRVINIDGQRVELAARAQASLMKTGNQWRPASIDQKGPLKRPGLQGPIDDAFMSSFVFVTPTGNGFNELAEKWVKSEGIGTRDRWRSLLRGEVRIRRDDEPGASDIAMSNLILWGDPASNKVIARVIDKLPIKWTSKEIVVGDKAFNASHHSLILIYPNPLNPNKYIVLNSGHTFREDHNRTNSQQTPKLPDWAVIDLNTPPNRKAPGKVVAAGFFDEHWQLSKDAPHE
jgi:hypothetical protein